MKGYPMHDYMDEEEEKYTDGLQDGLSSKEPLRGKYESVPGRVRTEVYVAPKEKKNDKK